ncbi:hypothetical protein LAUMK35_03631 [Mycobacterium pseudokansasii]|uniref:Uncharacterized protein n=1 Tax=Mycobacterium pseudokansasii TaxID=2341080 RepID=A0A498QTS0_9MYCO|nr:hypothetical protein LAUMK35_03631 [Mycobacterium pseudokansasii]VAZ98781.1 hypothetical protein LAUMK21_03628 [Mycobacterium pseudokansasii]VBA52356.1 hypothetical protein LAUMK142_03520 [Mycobacterium pseudokansasii]
MHNAVERGPVREQTQSRTRGVRAVRLCVCSRGPAYDGPRRSKPVVSWWLVHTPDTG